MARTTNLEIRAGIWLLLIIGVICATIILLGMSPDLFKSTYSLTIEVPDASGLAKGSDVFLAGAQIGKLVNDPTFVPGTAIVSFRVKINGEVKVRRDAKFVVRSAGFFGDKYVEVRPRLHQHPEDLAPFLENGGLVQGTTADDLTTLQSAALPLIKKADHMAGQLDDMVTRLNKGVLTDDTSEDLKHTVDKLPILRANVNSLAQNTAGLINQVKSGQGVLGGFLYDKQLKSDLAQFTANVNEHGLFFYTDDSSAPKNSAPARPSWRTRP